MNELNVFNEIKRKMQRRRYALKLNNGPFVRTLIASLALLLAFAAISDSASAKEIRIFPVVTDPTGFCAGLPVNTACDLVRAAAGLAPVTGPDAGITPDPGDELVLAPGTYTLVAPVAPPFDGTGSVVVPGVLGYAGVIGGIPSPVMEDTVIRSRNGATVTVITGGGVVGPVVDIFADGVVLGGNAKDSGMTITGSPATSFGAVHVGDPTFAAAFSPAQADEDIIVQNCFLNANAGAGVTILTPVSIETFKINQNEFRGNGTGAGPGAPGDGVYIGSLPGTAGVLNIDEIEINRNVFDSNFGNGVNFDNEGNIEVASISGNTFVRNCVGGAACAGVAFGLSDFDGDLATTRDIEDLTIDRNIVQLNLGFGIYFGNLGEITDLVITNNRDDAGKQGITGNNLDGIYFDGTSAVVAGIILPLSAAGAGTGVTDIDGLLLENNVINENGSNFNGVALGIPFNGVTFINSGDVENVTVRKNNVRMNTGSGFYVANGGDLDTAVWDANEILNNGTASVLSVGGPTILGVDGITVMVFGDVTEQTFTANLVRENINNGAFLASLTGNVERIKFLNGNRFEKNGVNFAPAIGDGVEISSFDDVNDIEWKDSQSNENGGSGLFIDANNNTLACYSGTTCAVAVIAPAIAVNRNDVRNVAVENGTFRLNGASAPIGGGNGIYVLGDKINEIHVRSTTADTNDDHGILISSTDDQGQISVEGGDFSNNDRNSDTIGAGLFFDSTQDMDDVHVTGVTANSNEQGVKFEVKGQNGRSMVVENNVEINDNTVGILYDSTDDLSNARVADNVLNGNDVGIRVSVIDRGNNLEVTGNRIIGSAGVGIGMVVETNNIDINNNSIRDNDTGIDMNCGSSEGNKARTCEGVVVNNNNIARNQAWGIDARDILPSESIDATNNWWGEPSGPRHASNPGGIGDKVSDKVNFNPFLGEPVGNTLAEFEITEFTIPATANVGEETVFKAKVVNSGSEEGTQVLTFKVFDGQSLVNSSSRTITLDPLGSTTVDFGFTFMRGGTFTVEVTTQDDSQSADIDVLGATGLTIEEVCDANDNNRIDDAEILTCIGYWVTGEEVPGTGQTISDAKILFLVELWVTGNDISTLPASAKASSFVESVVSFFAPAATVNQTFSAAEVAPGGSFTVTTTIKANQTLQGLLFNEQLPAGWTISNVTTAGGFYKPSENKWLWLGSEGVTTVSYTVNVPADAAEGAYVLNGSLKTSGGFATASSLSVRIVQPLSLNKLAFTGSAFLAQGTGIASVQVSLYNLAGAKVFEGTSSGSALAYNGPVLANGVYLVVATVNGANGQQLRSTVQKVVFIR